VKNKFLALTPPEKCHCFTTPTIYTKGQEISEGNCDVFNLPKKNEKISLISAYHLKRKVL
jgi:hypothetical protein